MHDFVAAVSASAARQHGLVRIDEFKGVELEKLRRLARAGVLQSVFKGVYRVSGSPKTWMQTLTAAVWSLGSSAVVSHVAAARLWRLDGFTGDIIEVTVGRERRGSALPVTMARANIPVHTTQFRLPEDTVVRDGLPVTSVERTLVDLARSGLDIGRLEAAIDSAIRLGYTDVDRIAERLAYVRGSGRWRVARLDNLLATTGGHTFLERRFLKLMRQAGSHFRRRRWCIAREQSSWPGSTFSSSSKVSWSRCLVVAVTPVPVIERRMHDAVTNCSGWVDW